MLNLFKSKHLSKIENKIDELNSHLVLIRMAKKNKKITINPDEHCKLIVKEMSIESDITLLKSLL